MKQEMISEGILNQQDVIPEGFKKTMFKQIISLRDGNSNPKKELDLFIEELGKYEIEYELHNTYDNSAIYNYTSAVHYHDKQLAPDDSVKFLALTSDVTHGIISQHCGYNKLSSWSGITPDKKNFVLVISIISNENTPTFISEIKFLIKIYPYLKEIKIVIIVDGDRAKWAAIRTELPLAYVILCLYHATENIKKHFGSLLRGKSNNNNDEINNIATESESTNADHSNHNEVEQLNAINGALHLQNRRNYLILIA